jgi:quercetin dioxygenase-like cupin family protein
MLRIRKANLRSFCTAVVLVCAAAAFVTSLKGEENSVPVKKADLAALADQVQHLDKVPVQEQAWGWLRWLVNDQLVPGATMTLGVVQINAGQKNPLHKHPNCDEIIYMISGTGEYRVGDQKVVLKAGDALRIPKNAIHDAKTIGDEPMKSVVVYDTGSRQFVPVTE